MYICLAQSYIHLLFAGDVGVSCCRCNFLSNWDTAWGLLMVPLGVILRRALSMAIIILAQSFSAFGETPWPPIVYQSYLKQCRESMLSQGMSSQKSDGVCYCLSSGLSKEFGMEEYDYMRAAQPNPKGSTVDRRLYKTVMKCMN